MNVLGAIKKMIANSGKSARAVSVEMGKSPNYMGATLAKVSDIGAANVARVAKACGYELILKGHGEEIPIDPPED